VLEVVAAEKTDGEEEAVCHVPRWDVRTNSSRVGRVETTSVQRPMFRQTRVVLSLVVS